MNLKEEQKKCQSGCGAISCDELFLVYDSIVSDKSSFSQGYNIRVLSTLARELAYRSLTSQTHLICCFVLFSFFLLLCSPWCGGARLLSTFQPPATRLAFAVLRTRRNNAKSDLCMHTSVRNPPPVHFHVLGKLCARNRSVQ